MYLSQARKYSNKHRQLYIHMKTYACENKHTSTLDSMMKESQAGEGHRHAILLARGHHGLVPDAAAGLGDEASAEPGICVGVSV